MIAPALRRLPIRLRPFLSAFARIRRRIEAVSLRQPAPDEPLMFGLRFQ
jgi:hypothetical protein